MNFFPEAILATVVFHSFRRTRMKKLCLALAAVTIVALSACSSAPPPGSDGSRAAGQKSATGENSLPGSSKATVVKEYFDAYASADPAEMRAAAEHAAKGSDAQKYLTHQANHSEASEATGYDRYVQKAEYRDGTVEVCHEGEDCGVFADLSFDDGKLSSFTVDGKNISDRVILGNGSVVKSHDAAGFEVLSSYQAVDGTLIAVVRFYAYERPISFSYTSTYRKPSRQQVESAESEVPSRVAAESNQDGILVFPNAENGGDLHLKFATDDDEEEVAGDLIVDTAEVPLSTS